MFNAQCSFSLVLYYFMPNYFQLVPSAFQPAQMYHRTCSRNDEKTTLSVVILLIYAAHLELVVVNYRPVIALRVDCGLDFRSFGLEQRQIHWGRGQFAPLSP